MLGEKEQNATSAMALSRRARPYHRTQMADKPDPHRPWDYLGDSQGLRERINRHTLGIALVVAPVIFGALSLEVLGISRATVSWVLVVVALFGGIGGWVHPPHLLLRPRTALAGVVVAVGALVASAWYQERGGADHKARFGYEFVYSIVLGGLPGVVLYACL